MQARFSCFIARFIQFHFFNVELKFVLFIAIFITLTFKIKFILIVKNMIINFIIEGAVHVEGLETFFRNYELSNKKINLSP